MRAIATDVVTQRGLPASVCVLAKRVNFMRKWQFYGTGVSPRIKGGCNYKGECTAAMRPFAKLV